MGNPLESLPALDSQRLTNARVKDIAQLHRKKHRERLGQFMIEGVRSVEAALDGGAQITELFLSQSASIEPALVERLRSVDTALHTLTADLERRFADTQSSQGVIAIARIPEHAADVMTGAARVLVLDGVQDPGNVGTLVRTAAWFGVDAVVSLPGTADFFSPKVVRATMGGVWDLPLFRFEDMEAALQQIAAGGRQFWGADMGGASVSGWRPAERSALVIGSEAHGLSDAVGGILTGRIHIPGDERAMAAESLNAAVAGGILIAAWSGLLA